MTQSTGTPEAVQDKSLKPTEDKTAEAGKHAEPTPSPDPAVSAAAEKIDVTPAPEVETKQVFLNYHYDYPDASGETKSYLPNDPIELPVPLADALLGSKYARADKE